MKLTRIKVSDFRGICFDEYRPDKAKTYESALILAHTVLTNKKDFRNITSAEITRVNKLLKICEILLETYVSKYTENINNITVLPYLSRAINIFYKEQCEGKNFLIRQRDAEKRAETKNGRLFHMADLCRGWIPKPTKTYMRRVLFRTFNSYPEQLYAALTFYLVKEFHINGNKYDKKSIQQAMHLIQTETNIRTLQKNHGAKSHSKTDFDDLYTMLKNAFASGKFDTCRNLLALQEAIKDELYVGVPAARVYVKRLKKDFPDNNLFKKIN